MGRIVLVRYDEIALKSRPVREKFEKILLQKMKLALKGMDFRFRRDHGRIFVETSEEGGIVERLAKLPGIASVSPAMGTEANLDDICSSAVTAAESAFAREGTFAVRARRIGRHDFSSGDVNEVVGSKLLEANPELSVDLDDPDQELFVEVRGDHAYVFTEIIEGVGGLPVGSQEGVVAIFSGDVSSSVAVFLMLKRGSPVYPVAFSPSHGGDVEESALDAAGILKEFYPELELCIVPLASILRKIAEEVPEESARTVCERLTLRLAEMVAKRKGAMAVVTGDLGRNAERPLSSWRSVKAAVEIPILQPLVGLEDGEMKRIAQEVGIRKASIDPIPWCSKTFDLLGGEADLKRIEEAERSFSSGLLESLLKNAEVKRV